MQRFCRQSWHVWKTDATDGGWEGKEALRLGRVHVSGVSGRTRRE